MMEWELNPPFADLYTYFSSSYDGTLVSLNHVVNLIFGLNSLKFIIEWCKNTIVACILLSLLGDQDVFKGTMIFSYL